jgi:hypothetical protein
MNQNLLNKNFQHTDVRLFYWFLVSLRFVWLNSSVNGRIPFVADFTKSDVKVVSSHFVYMRVTTVFTFISYEWSDLAQLYSLFYPHANSLTDVSITPVLHMLTLRDPVLCAH